MTKLVFISEVSIGIFACGYQKKISMHIRAYVHAAKAQQLERGKAAHLDIFANPQQSKSYFSITTKEGVENYLAFRKRDVELGHIVKERHTTIATQLQYFLTYIEAQMEECKEVIKQVHELCKEFKITAGHLKGELVDG